MICTAPPPRVPIDTRSLKKAILSKFLLFQPLMELSGIIDSSNRCCPLTAVAEFPGESPCLTIVSLITRTFRQLVSYVPCDLSCI